MPDYLGRIARVRAAMDAHGIDLLFLAPTANLQYFTGIERGGPNFGDVNYPGGWIAGAFLGLDRGPVLTFPRMVAEFDLDALPGADLRVLPDTGDPVALLRDVLASFGHVRRAAIDNRTWSETLLHLQSLAPDAAFVPARSSGRCGSSRTRTRSRRCVGRRRLPIRRWARSSPNCGSGCRRPM